MFKKITTLVLMLLSIATFAQAPQKFNYQAVIRDASGDLVMNQAISLRLSILKGSSLGQNVFQGDHSVTTDDFGVVSVKIGEPNSSVGDFSTIDWGADSYFLKTEVDLNGSSSFTEMGTTQFVSVPYAIHSSSSDTADFARAIASVDDADADAQNEIQSLRLSEDTLFLSGSNYVLLDGITKYISTCYSTDSASWWAHGNYINWQSTDGQQADRTVGACLSNQTWADIFNDVGFTFTTGSGAVFPIDRDNSLSNIVRYGFYQPTVKYLGIEFYLSGGGIDEATLQTELQNAITSMGKFSVKVYQYGELVKEYTKDDFEAKVYDFNSMSLVNLQFNDEMILEETGQRFVGITYEVCYKK